MIAPVCGVALHRWDHEPPESNQPPWMVTPTGRLTCSVYVPFDR